jgi:hypothetical protein
MLPIGIPIEEKDPIAKKNNLEYYLEITWV